MAEPRMITPVFTVEYNTASWIEDLAPHTDYYIHDCGTLKAWESLRPLPTRIFCPLNSYAIPPGRAVMTKEEVQRIKWPRIFNDSRVLLLQGAGDILHLAPFLAKLRDMYPHSRITQTAYRKFGNLLDTDPNIDFINCVEAGMPTDLLQAVDRHDHTHNFHHPRGVRELLYSAMAIGWNKFQWMELTAGMKISPSNHLPKLILTGADMAEAQHRYNVLGKGKKVGVHWRTSNISRDFPNIGDIITSRPDLLFVIFGDDRDCNCGSEFENVVSVAGQLTYRESAALINHMDAMICVDSVMLHLCKLFTVPTLALFGWSKASWSGPYESNFRFVEANSMDRLELTRVYGFLEEELGSWMI